MKNIVLNNYAGGRYAPRFCPATFRGDRDNLSLLRIRACSGCGMQNMTARRLSRNKIGGVQVAQEVISVRLADNVALNAPPQKTNPESLGLHGRGTVKCRGWCGQDHTIICIQKEHFAPRI